MGPTPAPCLRFWRGEPRAGRLRAWQTWPRGGGAVRRWCRGATTSRGSPTASSSWSDTTSRRRCGCAVESWPRVTLGRFHACHFQPRVPVCQYSLTPAHQPTNALRQPGSTIFKHFNGLSQTLDRWRARICWSTSGGRAPTLTSSTIRCVRRYRRHFSGAWMENANFYRQRGAENSQRIVVLPPVRSRCRVAVRVAQELTRVRKRLTRVAHIVLQILLTLFCRAGLPRVRRDAHGQRGAGPPNPLIGGT